MYVITQFEICIVAECHPPSASYRRPGEDMLNRLARPESLDSALQNAAGLNEEQFKMFKVGHRGNHWIEA